MHGTSSSGKSPGTGYYYRGDFNKIDDANWKCFTNSKYNAETHAWEFKKVPYVQMYP